ncbi:MAG: S-adenosylmethionine decarboxylase, partial [Bacillus sp. (in: firmicutes)]
INVYQENIFHTKCKLREFDLDNYLFGYTKDSLSPEEREEITERILAEMEEIVSGVTLHSGTIFEDEVEDEGEGLDK